jgi:hypothetical protein
MPTLLLSTPVIDTSMENSDIFDKIPLFCLFSRVIVALESLVEITELGLNVMYASNKVYTPKNFFYSDCKTYAIIRTTIALPH